MRSGCVWAQGLADAGAGTESNRGEVRRGGTWNTPGAAGVKEPAGLATGLGGGFWFLSEPGKSGKQLATPKEFAPASGFSYRQCPSEPDGR